MNEMKPLKFLLGNNTLSLLAGSETWIFTLAVQLKKMGHTVHCFSPELGYIAEQLEKEGIKCFKELSTSGVKPFSIVLEEEIDHTYDVIIANHNHIVKFLRSQYPRTPIISTIHGIIHEVDGQIAPEHPALDAGVQQFISVSEEVQAMLREKYNIDSIIIRNFLDTNHFKAKRKIAKGKPKQILFNSNYHNTQDPEVAVLRDVAKHYHAKLAAIGMNFAPTPNPMDAIEASDIVIGMGRSVLEGLAAGRISIVHGRWGTDGVINEESFQSLREVNFSGRKSNGAFADVEGWIREIDANYNPGLAQWGRNYILRDHNVVHAAEMFVNISRELLGQTVVAQDTRRPYRRQRDVK
jgi:hypothetical protein